MVPPVAGGTLPDHAQSVSTAGLDARESGLSDLDRGVRGRPVADFGVRSRINWHFTGACVPAVRALGAAA